MNDINTETIVSLFAGRVESDRTRLALQRKVQGEFRSKTWDEIASDVSQLAMALEGLGVQPSDRVAQLSENRYEWIVCDLAIQVAQAVHVPMHAPLSASQVADQVLDSGSKIVLVSNLEQANKLREVAERYSSETQFISYEPLRVNVGAQTVRSLEEVTAGSQGQASQGILRRACSGLNADSLATILYTSGTTGEPKGVMLTQRNLVSNAVATVEAFPQAAEDVKLSFLPLSHIFARTCDLYTWIVGGSVLALAESRDTVLADCAVVRPTVINGVPYFYQRVHRYLVEQGTDKEPGRLQALLGGRMRACCSGGAALPDYLFDFYLEQGVPLVQGYGLTESSPVITVSSPDAYKRGKVGRPIPGVEVKISEDGEILTRGPHVMLGFWNNEGATREVIRDGWLHTGDIGELDDDGYLQITGRIKELIVTAAGKNVVPAYLEALLCQDPLIEQAFVVGDGRNYLAALIVPSLDNLKTECEKQNIEVSSDDAIVHDVDVRNIYQQRIEQQLACVSHHEQVRSFALLNRQFSVERGEMTPKLSLRRKIIERNFADEIDGLYRRK